MNKLKERIDEGIVAIGKLHAVEIELTWSDYTPAAEVSEEAAAIAAEAIVETVGEEAFAPAIITSGSDDFHFYTIHNPELKATMIGIGADLGPGLHHPDMTFNREALDIGARVLAATLKKASLSVKLKRPLNFRVVVFITFNLVNQALLTISKSKRDSTRCSS